MPVTKKIHKKYLSIAGKILSRLSPTYKKLSSIEKSCENNKEIYRLVQKAIFYDNSWYKLFLPNYEQTVLIVTFGRTGSTLLQGLLNSIPEALIRGENNNFGYTLNFSYRECFLSWKKHSKKEMQFATSPWFGAYALNEDVLLNDMRNLFFKQLYPDGSMHRILGFKEIRYLPPDLRASSAPYPASLFGLLDFYKILFRNVKFIFHTRDYGQVIQSAWWPGGNAEETINHFTSFDAAVAQYSAENPDICYHTTYADILANAEVVKGLFAFIGAEYNEASVNKVLNTKHSYKPTQPWVQAMK